MDLIKLAAFGVGGYFVLDYLMKRQAATSTPATSTSSGATQAAPPPATKDIVYQLAANANPDNRPLLLTVWQWNYYYQQLRGVPGPGPETLFPDLPAERRITVDEWWTAGTPHGLAGLNAQPASRYLC